MQIIEFVEKGNLDVVREHLKNGYKIVSIAPVAETVALDGCLRTSYKQTEKGSIYAYIVLEN